VAAPDGFAEFVVARQAALLRTAYLLTGHAQDAEDLVQTTLVKVVPQWRRIRDDPEPYVRRAMVNENISRWRRRRWREQSADVLPELLSTEADHAELLVVRDALATLAPRQRAVLVLRYYEGMSEREIAAQLGIAPGTVKSQARDALARLRAVLPDDETRRPGPSGHGEVAGSLTP
jgi:RNA polymerase sigma-70 factor (sigma-E family)